jgi:putative ABC transport system permease protein
MPNWNHIVREHLAVLRLPPEREIEIVEEQALHLEAAYEDALADGLSAAEAEARAMRSYDWRLLECELSRAEQPAVARALQPSFELIERRGGIRMGSFIQDLRFGVRMLMKQPGFTLVAALTLTLGIGANTAIFSLVDGLLLRPVPYHEPERLVMLSHKVRKARRNTISYPNFSDWRERAQSFEGMAVVRSDSFNLTGVDRPAQLRGRMVNWNFFHLLGVQPQLGRLFVKEDDRYGAARTALLEHGMWREKFGGDAGVIGKKLLLNDEPYEVIGVLPQGFEYFRADDLYVPIGPFLKPQSGMTDRGTSMGGMVALARLKPGVTLAQANREMAELATQLEREYPAVNGGKSAQAEILQDVMSEGVRQSLWVLFGAVGFILLIACVNVANLLLARAADRRQEIALRLALGAGRWRIVRQLLSESLLLALLGGVFGVVLGRWMLAGLLALAPGDIPQLSRVSLNGAVLFFTLGVAALTSVLCGLLPAWQAARADLRAALKEAGRSSAGAARAVTRKTLLVVEVGLALALLVGAGLLARSMQRALSVDPGFNPENLLTMRVKLPDDAYPLPRRLAFYEESLARIGALPGVRAVSLTISLPIDGSFWDSVFTTADKPAPPRDDLPDAAMAAVTPNYFEMMGIRLLKGRAFTSADTEKSPHVTVINESLARRIWPGENPIGKRLRHGYPEYQTPWREVVGVVADVKVNGVERNTTMQAYFPFAQMAWSNFSIVVRTTGAPLQLAAGVERAIHTIDKDLPVFALRSMDQLLGNDLAARRLALTVLGSFAGLALLLAAVGIYGVISYSVRQRTHELGIRLALGAQRRDVLKLILTQGLKLAAIGIALGLGAAVALTRWMESLLFEVRPTDPLTFSLTALSLLLVALLACLVPARRATKVDPLVALRQE